MRAVLLEVVLVLAACALTCVPSGALVHAWRAQAEQPAVSAPAPASVHVVPAFELHR